MAKKRKTEAGSFDGTPFTYQATADGKVMISHNGRQVTILKGDKAAAFLKKIEGLPEQRQQLAMAKIWGNFKRGNERR